MKKTLVLLPFLLAILLSTAAQAQTEPVVPATEVFLEQNDVVIEAPRPPVEEKNFEIFDIEKAPSFPGGEQAMLQYLAGNIIYPDLAKENEIQGTVVVSFIVEKSGAISNAKILRSVGGGCDQEALRVVNAMPKWTPGEASGHPVRVQYTLPIRFRLE